MSSSAAYILTSTAVLRRVGAVAALVTLTCDFGFPSGHALQAWVAAIEAGVVIVFALDLIASRLVDPEAGSWLQRMPLHFGAGVVLLGAVLWVAGLAAAAAWTVVAGAQAYLLVRLLRWLVRSSEWLLARGLRPTWVMIGAYAALIGVGTLLLALPGARSAAARPWSVSDAFFTSTSAACVTGLAVRDVGSELSFRGQAALLALIQVGGLGPVTLTMFVSFLARRGLNMRQALAMREMLSVDFVGGLGHFMGFVLLLTGVVELAGAVALFAACPLELGLAQRVWWALFHAVSAFCNAGFGLHADSMILVRSDAAVCVPLMGLIVVGGIGYPVLLNLLRLRPGDLLWIRRWRARRGRPALHPPRRLSLQSRLTLLSTGILLLGGALLFFWREHDNALADEPPASAWLISVFQSVTPRTAGFNSVDLGELRRDTLLLLLVLMVIGAAPVSTGGGVRVVAVAIVCLTVRALARGLDHVTAFRRNVPRTAVGLSVTIVALYTGVLAAGVALLVQTQPHLAFGALVFEAVSALSTVGLSLGVTDDITEAGRLVLCLLMFVGRIGPLALLWAFVSRAAPLGYQYPEESVVV